MDTAAKNTPQADNAGQDCRFDDFGCVIMASGLGQRFGGNKLMADFRGQPLIARALAATDFIAHRVVVTRHEDVADYCRGQNVPVVLHALPYRSDTVRLGLEALPEVNGCFFCPGDQPLLTGQTVKALAFFSRSHPDCIIRPIAGGNPGAPILFPKEFFPELLTLPQGKGGSFLARQNPSRVRLFPIENPFELMDADTPDELKKLTAQENT